MPDNPSKLPKPYGYDLWKHLHDEHGLILLESELNEIMIICDRLTTKNKNQNENTKE